MSETARQSLRQRAGFLAENLLQRQFEERGVLAISFARRHLDEAGEKLGVPWKARARALAKIARNVRGIVHASAFESVRVPPPSTDYQPSPDEQVVRALLGYCDLIRWEGPTPIMSEVKSQFGPELDFRVEFQATQMIALRECAAAGIRVTLLYYVALPRPAYVEVPWEEMRQPQSKVRVRDIGRGYRFRARVPMAYRRPQSFEQLPRHLVPYSTEKELLAYLRSHFGPGSRPGLE